MIPYGRQSISADDLAAVARVLEHGLLTTGPAVEAFEQALCRVTGAPHACACSNGTTALHLAMLAARIGPGDRVLTSTNTFLASANCAEFVGATADFADIDPVTRCVSVETLARAWKPDVKAVVAVDFAGYPCATQEMADFVHARGAILIEDACHSIGGAIGEGRVGGLPWVDMTTFSFHPVKTITTGEGGAVLTANPEWNARMRLLRSHGMVRTGRDEAGDAPWVYEMSELGYNYRITDLQSALGTSQLSRLPEFVARRQAITDRYNRAFAGLPHLRLPPVVEIRGQRSEDGGQKSEIGGTSGDSLHPSSFIPHPSPPSSDLRPLTSDSRPSSPTSDLRPLTSAPSWHLYVVEIDFPALGKTRTQVMNELGARRVGTQVHYIPVHTQPYYRNKYGYDWGKCPAAEAYYRHALSLPLYPLMSDKDVEHVIRTVEEICGA